MLRITIELVPGGRDLLAKVIGRGAIGNVSNLADLSDYSCSFQENSWNDRVRGPYSGMLMKWPRNKHGAWEIVHAALTSALATEGIVKEALDRGVELKAALSLKAGGLLSVSEVAAQLGLSQEQVIERETFLVLILSDGSLAWPAFQFENRNMMEGIEKVLAAIQVDEPWAQLNFLFLHLKELGGKTVVQAIRDGLVTEATLAASHFGNHGAS